MVLQRQATIRDKQQQISREMTADVARQLRALYTRCWAERGRGAKNNALVGRRIHERWYPTDVLRQELFREGVEDIKFDLFSSVVARTADLLRHMLSVQLDAHAAEAAGMAQLVRPLLQLSCWHIDKAWAHHRLHRVCRRFGTTTCPT